MAEATLLDPHTARRKAIGWLVSFVGSVMAQQPQLEQVEGHLVWQFKAFLALRGHPLQGPVGRVAVDAYTGEVLADGEVATEMIASATAIARSCLKLEATTVALRPAFAFTFRWPAGTRTVLFVPSSRSLYRLLYNPQSPLNAQVLSTLSFV